MRAAISCVVWVVVVCAALVASPALATVPASVCLDGGALGTCMPWIDNNGNGVYDTGDEAIALFLGTSSATITGPWGSGNVNFYDSGTSPALREASALQGYYDTATWGNFCALISATEPLDGDPIAFQVWQGGCPGLASDLRMQSPFGAMTLEDTNGDGAYEDMALWDTRGSTLAAPSLYLRTNLECTDNNRDGDCDHFSLPWSNSQLLGMDPDDKQIWVPVDGPRITFNNPQLHQSPLLAARFAEGAVPTLSQWGLLVSLLALAAAGWWVLRRKQVVA